MTWWFATECLICKAMLRDGNWTNGFTTLTKKAKVLCLETWQQPLLFVNCVSPTLVSTQLLLHICSVCDVMCAMSCYFYTAVTQTSVLSGVHAVNYQFKEHLNYSLPAAFLPDWSTAEPPARENHLTSGWGSVFWPQNQRGNSCAVSVHPWKQCQSPPSPLWAPGLLFYLGYSIKPALAAFGWMQNSIFETWLQRFSYCNPQIINHALIKLYFIMVRFKTLESNVRTDS